MNILKQVQHQGDTQFYLIDKIPANAKKVEKQFIAASEQSGSFHALFGDYDMYEVEDGFALHVKGECTLNHSLKEHLKDVTMDEVKVLPKKDHRHSTVEPGIYFVGIQQRFDPLAGMKEKVRD
jgi:hypothetical protein